MAGAVEAVVTQPSVELLEVGAGGGAVGGLEVAPDLEEHGVEQARVGGRQHLLGGFDLEPHHAAGFFRFVEVEVDGGGQIEQLEPGRGIVAQVVIDPGGGEADQLAGGGFATRPLLLLAGIAAAENADQEIAGGGGPPRFARGLSRLPQDPADADRDRQGERGAQGDAQAVAADEFAGQRQLADPPRQDRLAAAVPSRSAASASAEA